MILYFSSTGNCRFAADKIAEATGDTAVSMVGSSENFCLKDGENLGIVIPTFFWGLPNYVDLFLSRAKFVNAENSYVFLVTTYGTVTGQIGYYVNKHLKKQGLSLSASYCIKTVDNWSVWYDVSDKENIKATLAEEAKQLAQVIEGIKSKDSVFINRDQKSLFMCGGARVMYKSARKTSHFVLKDSCIGCGLCAKNCPDKAIKMVEGKPVWTVKRCDMCLKCLHGCPAFAIQYGNKTEKNGQYNHGEYEV